MHIVTQAERDRCYDQGIKCYDECLRERASEPLLPTGAVKEVLVGLAFDLSIDS